MKKFIERLCKSIAWRMKWLLTFSGYRSLIFYEWTFCKHVPIFSKSSKTVVCVLDLNSFSRLEWFGNPWVFSESYDFRGGGRQHAFAAFTPSGRLVGFSWLEVEVADVRFFGVGMQLPNNVGYFSRLWVDEAFRSAGVAGSLIFEIQKRACQLGLSRIYSACVPENHCMQVVFKRTGWIKCCRIDRYFLVPFSGFHVMHVKGINYYTISGKKCS